MYSKIKTFFNLPSSHKWIFLKIILTVPLVELGIKTIKFKRTLRFLKLFINKNATPTPDKNEFKVVRRHNNFLNIYKKQLPLLGQCLSRSITLWFLLARKGINTDIRFGMKKKNEDLLAHSWVEYNNQSLMSEAEAKENYVAFSESILKKFIE